MMLNKYLILMSLVMTMLVSSTTIPILMKKEKMMLEWSITSTSTMKMSAKVLMDNKSMTFMSCVTLITYTIILYSKYYMSSSNKKNKFLKLIMAFVSSMMILIVSPNMITAILGWEGLGLSSFMLIMFYQNKKSLNSSFFTIMMNRVGDIMLVLGMVKMMDLSSWSFESMMFNKSTTLMSMITLAALSKSAQIPFSSWLTEAMAAPTPISALVHSSTLVTAGVLIMIRFETTLKYSSTTWMMLLTSISTLIMASMNSLTEWDIKKVVALSTLSQLSMMFISISMNLFNLAMFHMLVHATFKALIFVCSSSFISMANTQDIRMMGSVGKNMFMTQMTFNLSNLTLTGFPFMSSFFSKEMIMEMIMIKKMNLATSMLFYLCMMATIFYSGKLMLFLNTKKKKKSMYTTSEGPEQKMSKITLLLPSIVYGNKMNWIMNMNFKIPAVNTMTKMLPATMILMVMINIKNMFLMKTMSTNKMMKKLKTMSNFMWFMKNMSINLKKSTLTASFKMFKSSEKVMLNQTISMKSKMVKKMSMLMFFKTHKNMKKINIMIMISMMSII